MRTSARRRTSAGSARDDRARHELVERLGAQPAVGRDVQHAGVVLAHDERERLRRRRRRARPGTAASRRARARGVGLVSRRAQRWCAPAPSTGAARSVVIVTAGMVVLPLGEQPLDLGRVHRGVEARVRAQRRVLGERQRVRRPRAVRRGRREPDDLAHADRRGGVEHAPRPVDVHARHQRLVVDRVDDRGEVHQHVDPFEQRLQVVTGDVHPVQLEVRRAPRAARARRGRRSGRCPARLPNAGSKRCPRKPATPVTATVRVP